MTEQSAQVKLEMEKECADPTSTEACSNAFIVTLNGTENVKPVLEVTDKDGYTMMSIADDGTTGDCTSDE